MLKLRSNFSWKNLIFLTAIVLALLPQTRTPIQIALNKIKVAVFAPSAFAKADQTKIEPFDYVLKSMEGIATEVGVGKGKITFISYWATWCPPCIAELPSIESLYKDYGNRIQFVLITNEDPEIVSKFLKKRRINLPAVNPVMNIPEMLYEKTIPTNYLIDKEGNIIIKEKGAADWNSKNVRTTIDDLLASD